jgi:c-di-GMP-binding flagellar brake protein YcgR
MPVRLALVGKTLTATSTNISEGGMALMLHEALPKGANPVLKFSLPDSKIQIEVESEIAWADMKGLAGFRFHPMPKSAQDQLEQWLNERLEEEFPGSKDLRSETGAIQ